MNQNIESNAVHSADGYDSCDSYETESVLTSKSDKQQQQQSGIGECQVRPLGSNNYQDSNCYLYTKNNSRKGNLYLRCKNSVKHHCLARVTVRDNIFQEAEMTIGHNHLPEKTILEQIGRKHRSRPFPNTSSSLFSYKTGTLEQDRHDIYPVS